MTYLPWPSLPVISTVVSHPVQTPSALQRNLTRLSALLCCCLLLAVATPAHPQSTISNQWVWIAGNSTLGRNAFNNFVPWPGVYGTLGIAAAGNNPGGRAAASNWTDQNGNLWLFGGNGMDSVGTGGYLNDLWEFTPSTGQWTWMAGSSTVPA